MRMRFKVLFEWNEDVGGYTVSVPALPGCITEGDNLQEAMENAREAIIGYLEALKAKGEPVPSGDPQMFFGDVEVSV